MKFVFSGVALSTNSRESKGKVYYGINIDCDGEIVTFDCKPEVVQAVKKYQPYNFFGEYIKGEYQGRVYSRIGVTGISEIKSNG